MAGIASCGRIKSGKGGLYRGGRHLQLAERLDDETEEVGDCVAHGNEGIAAKVPEVTGVILAGGASSRMGSNKALLPRQGLRFIEWIHKTLAELFDEVIVVTNTPEQYKFLPCRKVPDLYPGKGVLAGIHSGLAHSSNNAIFVVACDMPYLNEHLIRHLCMLPDEADMVIPSTEKGFEPLHALYRKPCLSALDELLQKETRRVVALLSKVKVRELRTAEISQYDPELSSFTNINTPEEYYQLRSETRPLPPISEQESEEKGNG